MQNDMNSATFALLDILHPSFPVLVVGGSPVGDARRGRAEKSIRKKFSKGPMGCQINSA
jgi:hypothetical protein